MIKIQITKIHYLMEMEGQTDKILADCEKLLSVVQGQQVDSQVLVQVILLVAKCYNRAG